MDSSALDGRRRPIAFGDAPHAFARTVFLDAQVDGFGVVTQQGGGLEFGEAFDAC